MPQNKFLQRRQSRAPSPLCTTTTSTILSCSSGDHRRPDGRRFNREVINLGFAGNGKMEPEVTTFVTDVHAALRDQPGRSSDTFGRCHWLARKPFILLPSNETV
jgi:hypothetical protein